MNLPFTRAQFFEVFAVYNTAVWPMQFVLTLLAVVMVLLVLRWPERAGRPVSFGLALLWGWLAFAYHLAFFWSINPAAPVFAAISLMAAAAFAWVGGVRGALRFKKGLPLPAIVGVAIILFALVVYPAIGEFLGHHYPASPTFGLPCPTTLFTFGILLMALPTLPKVLIVGPLAWAVIGSSAAVVLGVTQDLGLLATAALGVYMLLRKTV